MDLPGQEPGAETDTMDLPGQEPGPETDADVINAVKLKGDHNSEEPADNENGSRDKELEETQNSTPPVVNGDCSIANEENGKKRKAEYDDSSDLDPPEEESMIKKTKLEAVRPQDDNSADTNLTNGSHNKDSLPDDNDQEEDTDTQQKDDSSDPVENLTDVKDNNTSEKHPVDETETDLKSPAKESEQSVSEPRNSEQSVSEPRNSEPPACEPRSSEQSVCEPRNSARTDHSVDSIMGSSTVQNDVLNLTAKPSTEETVDSSQSNEATTKEGDSNGDSKENVNSKNSSDSDKENVDCPMDLTLSSKPVGAPGSDVIMLSDEEEMAQIKTCYRDIPPELVTERKYKVKTYQNELRNEEAKLVLLKKIHQSQLLQQMQDVAAPTKTSQPQPQQHTQQTGSTGGGGTNRPGHTGPPPLVKGSQPMSNHKQAYPGNHGNNQPPQLTRVMQNQHSHNRNLSRSSQSQGPPPLVMAPNRPHSQAPSQRSSSHHLQNSRISSLAASAPQPPAQPEQTPAQRQAAAKLALRKQLEKTLLQIPPPKPPPPEMNFIPSLAGNDFMLLVGLEEVVKFIVDIDAQAKGEKGPEVKYVFNPFVCVQCGTDFTPVWKRDKPGSKNVICEQCVTSNQKKALKQEHTNRLKSAFVKALQQEQEIEQRMQAQTSTTTSSTASVPSAPVSSHHSGKDRERERERDRDRDRDRDHSSHRDELSHSSSRSSHSHSSHGHSGSSSHSSHHGSSSSSSHAAPVNLSTNFKPTNEQIRQHQNLIQAHQAQLRGAALAGLPPNFNSRLMYPFAPQHLTGSSANKADLQRQYLLDMIPRSLPGSNVLWRT